MAIGDISAQQLTTDNEDYQPSGTITYRILWVAAGGETNQTVRLKDTDGSGVHVHLYQKDASVKTYNGFQSGSTNTIDTTAGGFGMYINNQYFLNLSGASTSGNAVIFWLLQVSD